MLNSYFSIRHKLPALITFKLFGHRKKYGPAPPKNDPTWQEWQARYLDIYLATQKKGVGNIVNNAGYKILHKLNFEQKDVLEIGPGDINHMQWWNGKPRMFYLADNNKGMIDHSKAKMHKHNIPCTPILMKDGHRIPLSDASVDIILSFYSLEHLYPLDIYLDNMLRLLKPGGLMVGAIPAEGGLMWGLGRLVTSRRWLKKHTALDPDKIICWGHPNFADEILSVLDCRMTKITQRFWPFLIPSIDFNLVIKFIYQKPHTC